ncbi:MAG TPA: TIGR00725 family protein [Blastocatellia bacterium]|nr:TIGR00725 family protein [Blastocatellia bacterium]
MASSQARRPQATIIGDSDASPELCSVAEQIGGMLAQLGITVITGGGGGVMEAACRGAAKAGGTTVGILPSSELNDANPWCSVVIPTGLGHARNVVNVLCGDFVVALGRSAGTLSEVCFAWIQGRPILTVKGFDRWLELTGNELDGRGTSTIIECADLESLSKTVVSICGDARPADYPDSRGEAR